ncbi:hypothetical protein QBC42DRAFT_296472 [Cladorrhinum samala]|uniref:Fungal-type protein kinase domain-containing protein n=1 Tax=Cladorrhinum samala TaxID=585594 RepID=A0AAV9HPZ3_9PEZI|nr:hypothetical protein QBC42DRAFT_296472 [Cladorrhinum samala]
MRESQSAQAEVDRLADGALNIIHLDALRDWLAAFERGSVTAGAFPGFRESGSNVSLREGLQFPQPFIGRTFSCVVTAPLGRSIQRFASIRELLGVMWDLVEGLRSLHLDGRMLHRDVAVKSAVLDIDNRRPVEPLVGWDGFMAIGILSWRPHTYRHELESLFYMFLADDFVGIFDEFSADFAPLRNLAQALHQLLFPCGMVRFSQGPKQTRPPSSISTMGWQMLLNWPRLLVRINGARRDD